MSILIYLRQFSLAFTTRVTMSIQIVILSSKSKMEVNRMEGSRFKLFAMDFDNTMAIYEGATYSWELISQRLGVEPEHDAIRDAYYRREFDNPTRARRVIELFKANGLTEGRLREIFEGNMEPAPGIRRLFLGLKDRGIKTAVISGTIRNVYDIFASRFGISADYVSVAHNFIFDRAGALSGESVTDLDYEGKVTALQGICDRMGIGLDECAFVGDADNDLPLLKRVGLPIAVNTTDPAVRAASRVVLDKDLSRVLVYL